MNIVIPKPRGKILEGVVVSNRMAKTVTVLVERLEKAPKYGKYIRVRKKYLAHTDSNEFNIGERVRIGSSRPLSKRKHFRVIDKIDASSNL